MSHTSFQSHCPKSESGEAGRARSSAVAATSSPEALVPAASASARMMQASMSLCWSGLFAAAIRPVLCSGTGVQDDTAEVPHETDSIPTAAEVW